MCVKQLFIAKYRGINTHAITASNTSLIKAKLLRCCCVIHCVQFRVISVGACWRKFRYSVVNVKSQLSINTLHCHVHRHDRQHICYSAYAIARPSVRLSIRRVDHRTRSQAVARIADRTAKNCRGHVTRPRPLLGEIFVRLLVILHTKPCTKFEVSSSSSFGDMFDHMPKKF